MRTVRRAPLRRRIITFCDVRANALFAPREADRFRRYLLDLIDAQAPPPRRGAEFDWGAVASASGVGEAVLSGLRSALRPAFLAIEQEARRPSAATRSRRPTQDLKATLSIPPATRPANDEGQTKRRGPRAAPVVEFPPAATVDWDDPNSFTEALDLHMRRHNDTSKGLERALAASGQTVLATTIASWRRGQKEPRSTDSLRVLRWLERRYRLPAGYFRRKLSHPSRSPAGYQIAGISPSERRRLSWHLPDDFDDRSFAEQEEILEWVRRVIVSGSTEYRRYQAAAMKVRFGLRFPEASRIASRDGCFGGEDDVARSDCETPRRMMGQLNASNHLDADMAALIRFKSATLTPVGYQRSGVWGPETASQKIEHLGLLFGALTASPSGPVRGYGARPDQLALALLVFPQVWDWYVQWREARRGFYTAWETDMLDVGISLTRRDTGWLRQTPSLADRLEPIAHLVTAVDIEAAREDWAGACDATYKHLIGRCREIGRVARVHRDPFEPILAVLEAESPVSEYRKITEEILRLMPDERRHPRAAAEAVRAFLLLRLGLHLGLRQRNLRELLLCPRGQAPTAERKLIQRRRGELRWSERDAGWEVFIPSDAFKNAGSSFFGQKPFRLLLPDLGGLYELLEAYITRHRARLLMDAEDPGTLFVKTVKVSSRTAAYDQNTFYEAWRLAIQRYGIYNPYTGRGAIRGLLPHGPHNVRDVLATHILKRTGSYEQASYAIQDTPQMVAQHYGRFLPQDKAAIAAKVLNEVWAA